MNSSDNSFREYIQISAIAQTLLGKIGNGTKALAIAGNLIILIVFLTKDLRKHSMSFYICVQAVFDSIKLGLEVYFYFNFVAAGYMAWLRAWEFCFLVFYWIIDMNHFLHVYLLMLTTADRLMFIIYPSRFGIIRKLWFQCIILASLIGIASMIYIPVLMSIKDDAGFDCMFLTVLRIHGYTSMNLVLLCVLPSIIMLITSTKLILIIRKSKGKFHRQKGKKDANQNKSKGFAVNILAADLCFLVSTIIKYIGLILFDETYKNYSPHIVNFFSLHLDLINYICKVLIAVSSVGLYTSPFFVHLLTHKLFQKVLFEFFTKIFKCKKNGSDAKTPK